MIKFKIDSNENQPDEEKKVVISLEFHQTFGSDVSVKAIEEDGTGWNIISFRSDGTFYRHKGVPEYLNFQIEDDGRIVNRD